MKSISYLFLLMTVITVCITIIAWKYLDDRLERSKTVTTTAKREASQLFQVPAETVVTITTYAKESPK